MYSGPNAPENTPPNPWWGGGGPEKIYRGARELLFTPKKGGLENRNKYRPKVVVGEGAGGGVPLM